MSGQRRLRTVIMRGGSSKGVFLRRDDVPDDDDARRALLLALFGSPDRRQIDGLGGADLLTSKCAIIGPPTRPDADLDYTFAQIGIEDPVVSYDVNCGNISAAVGVYAIEEGYVAPREPRTLVRVHNTNTGKILRIHVPVADGAPLVEGDCRIDGVPGTGAPIAMDFSGTAGAATGRLLPTGSVRDRVHVPSLAREVDVSVVDLANLCAFIDARGLGLTGAEPPGALAPPIWDALEEIRQAAAGRAGISSSRLPFQVLVGAPRSYATFTGGEPVDAAGIDLVARGTIDRTMHKAYSGTGGACLAVAARIPGTVVHGLSAARSAGRVTIGHPSGTLPIDVDVVRDGAGWAVREVSFLRTARRLMEGYAFVRCGPAEAARQSFARST